MSNREEVTSESSRRTRQTPELLMQLPLDWPPLNSPPDDSPTLYYSPLPPRSPRPFPLQRSTSLTLRSRFPLLLHRHSPSFLHRSEPLHPSLPRSEPLHPSLPHSPLPLRPASEPPRPMPPAHEMVIDVQQLEEVNPVQPPAGDGGVCWDFFYDEARLIVQWFVGSLMSLCSVTTLNKLLVDDDIDSKARPNKQNFKTFADSEVVLCMVIFLILYPIAHLGSLMFSG